MALRLLVADRARRMNRGMLLFFAAFAGGMWWAAGYFDQWSSRAVATSMAVAVQLGPLVTLMIIPRPLWYLPASRREVWRASWIVSTLGVPALTTAAKLIAVSIPWGPGTLGIASIALSGLYDLAAAGAGSGLVVLAIHPRPAQRALVIPWAVARLAGQFLLPVSGMALFYLPAWTSVTIPVRWPELTFTSAVVVATGLALAIATWFYAPTPQAPANRIAPRPAGARRPRHMREPRLTGIPRLLVRETGWTLMIGGSLALAAVLFVVVASRVAQKSDLLELLQGALRVADAGPSSRTDTGLVAFNLLIWYGLFAAAMAARFPLIIRHLRALPIGAIRLNAMLVGWPALVWIVAWIAGAMVHYAVLGYGPTRPHAPSILASIGMCAMAQAATLRLTMVTRFVVFTATAGLVPFVLMVVPPGPLVLVLLGLASLAAATALNRLALAHSATYRESPLPIVPAFRS